MFDGLGNSVPYVSVWFDGPRGVIAQMAQLGPECFSWLVDERTRYPTGCVLHDFSQILADHDVLRFGGLPPAD
ncbi:MAG: hypothetical protein KC492_01095 [Myxococcales bacterium]|nr:hypothetical protein [Myxococcales bacterium]